MSSDADICNMALSHLGNAVEIQDLAAEKSKEAQACRRFYAQCRDQVLRDFAWPFATRFVALALVEADPTAEWGFSYRYPSGCMTPRRIVTRQRVETEASRVPFRLARDATGQLILTDLEDPTLEYTEAITDPSQFDPDFVAALALLLAGNIGPRVAGGDQFKLANRAFQLYATAIEIAKANAANAEQPDPPAESSFITGRT